MLKLSPFKKPDIFYGYWIVIVLFVCCFIHSGCGFYVFSLFINPLQEEFGWGRGDIMMSLTIYFFITGGTSPLIGRLVNRYGARKLIAIGGCIQAGGFALLTQMDYLWQYYATYALIGTGMAASGMVPATTVVSNWFIKRRGTALGIMATGIGAGGLVMAPLVGGHVIPNFGWQTSYLVLAGVCCIVIPLALLLIKMRPSDMGLYPDGEPPPLITAESMQSAPATEGITTKMAFATSTFWLLFVSFLTNGFSHLAIVQNQVPYLEDMGFPSATAATAIGIVGLGSLIGKFGFGWLCDRMPVKYAWSIAQCLQLSGILIFLRVEPTSPSIMLWLYTILLGLGIGGWLATMSMFTSTYFGLASYGVIFGMLTLGQTFGSALGPLVAGFMYDSMQTYRLAFIIFPTLYAVSIPTGLAVRLPKS